MSNICFKLLLAFICCVGLASLSSCGPEEKTTSEPEMTSSEAARYQAILDERIAKQAEEEAAKQQQTADESEAEAVKDIEAEEAKKAAEKAEAEKAEAEAQAAAEAEAQAQAEAEAQAQAASADALRANLQIGEDYRDSFIHGEKPAEFQKYIVLHDTEGGGDGWGVVSGWDSSGQGVAAHFVVGKDGSIVQCVSLDKIAHHAGFGDAGHNAQYGVEDESRDDKVGTVPIGDWAPDYGMNSYSIGIEMVHIGGEGDYPEAQLNAVDNLIAYIDAYYGGNAGTIIDHKAWRSGNSDTSPEFAGYLANYQDHRTHN